MEPITLAALAALALKLTSFLKFLVAREPSKAVTQLVAWASGVAVALVAAHADLASDLEIAGSTMGDLNFWSQVLVGLSLASVGSVVYDVKSAVDGSDTALEPSLHVAPAGPTVTDPAETVVPPTVPATGDLDVRGDDPL